jgi:hypothetical protein
MALTISAMVGCALRQHSWWREVVHPNCQLQGHEQRGGGWLCGCSVSSGCVWCNDTHSRVSVYCYCRVRSAGAVHSVYVIEVWVQSDLLGGLSRFGVLCVLLRMRCVLLGQCTAVVPVLGYIWSTSGAWEGCTFGGSTWGRCSGPGAFESTAVPVAWMVRGVGPVQV